jgi:hypothetical protein
VKVQYHDIQDADDEAKKLEVCYNIFFPLSSLLDDLLNVKTNIFF